MKKYKLILLACLSLCVYCGCVEDKGSYDYVELNELTISGMEKAYVVEQLTNVKIIPEITLDVGEFNPDNYTYVWVLYSLYSNPFDADTISREKDLDIEIMALTKTYKLHYEVKNKESGLIYTKSADFTVINSFSIGLMALSRVNDDANLTFINMLDAITEDAYEKINGEIVGKNPRGIRYIAGEITEASPMVVIMTDDERGGTVVNSLDLGYVMDFSEMFYFQPERIAPQVFGAGSYGLFEYVINAGAIYTRDASGQELYPKYGVKIKGDYDDIAPFEFYSAVSPGVAYFYDRVKKRFVYMRSPLQGNSIIEFEEKEYEDPEDDPREYNPNNVDLDMIWGGLFGPEFGRAHGRAIMEDDEGQRYLLSFRAENAAEFTPLHKTPLTTDWIKQAKTFASPPNGLFLYYAYENKIVCLSAEYGTVVNIYEFADGQQIDHIECSQGGDSKGDMLVGVSDGSRAKKSGSIVLMDMSTDGSLKEVKRYENVCGQVVDFEYKD